MLETEGGRPVGEHDGGKPVGREKRIAEGVSLRLDERGEPTGIRISFQFRGAECRERLALAPTKPNQVYAVRLRGEILNAIGRGTFNYADYFPASPRAKRFGFVATAKTIGALLDEYEAITAPAVSPSTWKGYDKILEQYLRPWFGTTRILELTPAEIRAHILAEPVVLKTARNILSVLRCALDLAINDDSVIANPVDRVKLRALWPAGRRTSDAEADPFTFEEMEAIFAACHLEEEADYWRVAFGTGMRPSEQIELHWPRVDLEGFRIRIELARVTGLDGQEVKGPKTLAGKRWIDLTRGAYEALQRQWGRTGGEGAHVFLDARYGLPWASEHALRMRFWRTCRAAKVRYRKPYQTRHTFASALLAAGHRPLRVAGWMGHRGTEMLDRHYTKWIEQGANPETRAALAAFFAHPSPTVAQIVALPL